MKMIDLICVNCGKQFQKQLREYNRQIKAGKDRFFCNLSCVASTRNKENPDNGNPQNLVKRSKDEYTPFRWYILRALIRNKKKNFGCDITIEYLKKLWEEQNGICPFTKWSLILPAGTDKAWEINSPMNASLDRIDNSKGYIQGNVRFTSVMANIARQTFTDGQLIEFCKAVSNVN